MSPQLGYQRCFAFEQALKNITMDAVVPSIEPGSHENYFTPLAWAGSG